MAAHDILPSYLFIKKVFGYRSGHRSRFIVFHKPAKNHGVRRTNPNPKFQVLLRHQVWILPKQHCVSSLNPMPIFTDQDGGYISKPVKNAREPRPNNNRNSKLGIENPHNIITETTMSRQSARYQQSTYFLPLRPIFINLLGLRLRSCFPGIV